MRRLLLMADYHCNPLWWDDSHPDVADFGPHVGDMNALGVSPPLAAKLSDWAEAYNSSLNWDYPGSGTLWNPEQWLFFLENGELLTKELEKEFGDHFVIRYFHRDELAEARILAARITQ